MEDPVTEIRELIPILYTEAPDVQRNVVANYFTSDASFTHPFFRIQGFPGSIWSIHMIYRWCKVLSPHLKVEVESAAFDKETLLLYVSVRQNFRLRFVPFYNASVNFVTALQLSTEPDPEPAYDDLAIIQNFVGPDATELTVSNHPIDTKSKRKKKATAQTPKSGEMPSWRTGNPYSALASPESPLIQQDAQPKVKYFVQSQNDLYQVDEWAKLLTPWGVGAFVVVAMQICFTIFGILGTLIHEYGTWATQRLFWSTAEMDDPTERQKSPAE